MGTPSFLAWFHLTGLVPQSTLRTLRPGWCHRPEPLSAAAINALCPLHFVIFGVLRTSEETTEAGAPLVCSAPSRGAPAQKAGFPPEQKNEVCESNRHRREQNTEFMNFE